MADRFVEGLAPDGVRWWACVAPEAKFTEAKLSQSRLGASLTPFSDLEAAQAALTALHRIEGGRA